MLLNAEKKIAKNNRKYWDKYLISMYAKANRRINTRKEPIK